MGKYLDDNRRPFPYTTEEFLSLSQQDQNDPDIVLKCLKNNGLLLEVVPERFREDINCVKAALESADHDAWEFVSARIKEDDRYIYDLFEIAPMIYFELSQAQRCHKNFILSAIKLLGVLAMHNLCSDFYEDVEILCAAMEAPDQNTWTYIDHDDKLTKSKLLVEVALKLYGPEVRNYDMNWVKAKLME